MNIIKRHKNNNFVVLDKTALNDPNLSWQAKGLHSYLMGLPTEWEAKNLENYEISPSDYKIEESPLYGTFLFSEFLKNLL